MAFLDSLYIDPGKFRAWVRNVGASYADLATGGAVFFLLTPVIVRHLGTEGYAVWLLSHTITFYLAFLDLGIGSAEVRYGARFNAQGRSDRFQRLVGTSFASLLIAGVVASIIAAAMAFAPDLPWIDIPAQLRQQFRSVLAILSVNLLITFPTAALTNAYFGLQRFDLVYGRSIALRLLAAALQVYVLRRGYGVVALAIVECSISVARAIIDAVVVNTLLPGLLRKGLRFHRRTWLRIRRFAIWASFDDILASGTEQLDRIFIAVFLPLGLIAPYAICKSVGSIVSLVIEPMTETFYPMATELQASRKTDALQKLLVAGSKATTALALPLVIFLGAFGADVAALWVPEVAADISPPLIALIVLNLMVSVYLWTSGIVLMALNHVRAVALITLAEVALAFLFIWFATEHLGIVGIAAGSLAANILMGATVQLPLVCRTVGIRLHAFLSTTLIRLGVAAVPACLTAVAIRRWIAPGGWYGLAATGALLVAVFLPCYVLVGLTAAERRRYHTIVRGYLAPPSEIPSQTSPQ